MNRDGLRFVLIEPLEEPDGDFLLIGGERYALADLLRLNRNPRPR